MFVLRSVNIADMPRFQTQFSNARTHTVSWTASFCVACRAANVDAKRQTVGAVPVSIRVLTREQVCLLGCKGLGIQQGVHSDPISLPNKKISLTKSSPANMRQALQSFENHETLGLETPDYKKKKKLPCFKAIKFF